MGSPVARLLRLWRGNLSIRLGLTMALLFGLLVTLVLGAALLTARHVMLETIDAALGSLAGSLGAEAAALASLDTGEPPAAAVASPQTARSGWPDRDADQHHEDRDRRGEKEDDDDDDEDDDREHELWERLEHRESLSPNEVALLGGQVLLGARNEWLRAGPGQPVQSALERVPQIGEGFLRLAGARGEWLSMPQPLGLGGITGPEGSSGRWLATALGGPETLSSPWLRRASRDGITFETWGPTHLGIPGGQSYRLAIVPVRPLRSSAGSTYYLALSVPLGEVGRQLRLMAKRLGMLGLAALLPVALLSAVMVRRAFKPVAAIAAVAGAIDDRSLGARIEMHPRDQTLQRLVDMLNAMLARLEAAFEAQARFVQDASHELRTPLARLRTGLDVALRHPRSEGDYRQSLEAARDQVERLTRLTNHLLRLAQHDRGARPERERVDLSVAAATVLEEFSVAAAQAGVDLSSDIPEGLTWNLDPVGVAQILTNLVENALRATPRGGSVWIRAWTAPPPGETVATAEGAPWLWLEVGDTGRGLQADELKRIFDRFVRLEPGRDPRGGAGLGLAICRAIVREHGGLIRAESQPGAGSRFQVVFPPQAGSDVDPS